jgi:2,3-bisphosphoglycerate-dependent phosphoglycerate mutase
MKLILVRHGESLFNKQNRFTGWININLTKKGLNQAKKTGIKLEDYKFTKAYTSKQLRAHQTLYEILYKNKFVKGFVVNKIGKFYSKFNKIENDKKILQIIENQKLNERSYGNLQGLNKEETGIKIGEEKLFSIRRSFKTKIPGGESLYDTYKRVIDFYKNEIEKNLEKNDVVIICAHGNSLRSLIKYLEKISDENISKIELKLGVPIIYELNENKQIKKNNFSLD